MSGTELATIEHDEPVSLPATTDNQPTVKTAAAARIEAVNEMLKGAYANASQLILTPEESKALAEDFADEAFRRGAGGDDNLIYIEHAYLRQRLNSVLGIGAVVPIRRREWTETFEYTKDGNRQKAIRLYVDLILVARGCVVGEAVGDATYYPSNQKTNYSDALESAKSNAFRRCCKEFGVGLQAWMKGWAEAWKERHPASGGGGGSQQSAPQATNHKCPACNSGLYHNPENAGQKKPVWKCKNKDCTGGGAKRDGGNWPWASFETDPFTPPDEQPQQSPPEAPQYGEHATTLRGMMQRLGIKQANAGRWLATIMKSPVNSLEEVFGNEATCETIIASVKQMKDEGWTAERIADPQELEAGIAF